MNQPLRVIVSGGGTGGHIFPALSIANAIKAVRPDSEILFVGAEGRMEMQRVQQVTRLSVCRWQASTVSIYGVMSACCGSYGRAVGWLAASSRISVRR